MGSPVSYALTGPSSGAPGVASTNFTLTPSNLVTDTVSFSDGGAGGTFAPTSLSWSLSLTAETFTYTPASLGAKTITLTSGLSDPITGNPRTYTAGAGGGIIVNPMVSKWGVFVPVLTSGTPAASGRYPLAAITAQSGDPTVKVNGSSVSMGISKVDLLNGTHAFVAYQLQCGSVSNIPMTFPGSVPYTAPTATVDATSASKGLVVSSAVLPMFKGIASYTITNGGSGYAGSFAGVIAGGSPTQAASVIFVVTGGAITQVVPQTGDWFGHGVGYTSTFNSSVNGNSGTGCTFTCVVGNLIHHIPVISGGTGLTTKPTITITDSTGSGALAAPNMSGPAPGDTVTYSAPANWLTTSLGNAPAATDAHVFNYSGQIEGSAYSLPGFDVTETMEAGAEHPPQSTNVQTGQRFTGKDLMFGSGPWTGSGVTLDVNQNPTSWTPGGTINSILYQSAVGYEPIYGSGTWTIKYRDAFYSGGTTATTTMSLTVIGCYTGGTPTRTVSGDVVTITIPVTFSWGPGSFTGGNPTLSWTSSDGHNHVTHPNNTNVFRPLVMGPGNTDRGLYYDASDTIIANLTGPGGTTPSFIRFMDSNFSFGGVSNYSTNSDRMPANLSTWASGSGSSGLGNPNFDPGQPGNVIQFQFARFYNSDPSNATYAWSSPKLYNPGWVPTGTDSLGAFLNIADGPNGASDNGRIMLASNPQNYGVVEFRTTQAGGHGLKTGQVAKFFPPGGAITLPWTIRGNVAVFGGASNFNVFVTGPQTVATAWTFGSGSGSTADTINSTTEIPIVLDLIFTCPVGNPAPVEFFCTFISRLPNSDYWHNAAPLGTTQHDMTGFHYTDGFTAGSTLGPSNGVRFEFNNEYWNTGNTFTHFFLPSQANFSAYAPSGASIYGGFYSGGSNMGSDDVAELFSAAQAFEAFKAGWVAAGRSPTQLKHYIGIQWGGGASLLFCNQIPIHSIQCDGLAVAPYVGWGDTLDSSYFNAFQPPGINGSSTMEAWPVWQLNDITAFYIAFDLNEQANWQASAQYTVPAGIPLVCYEGGYQVIAPGFSNFSSVIEDQFHHPSFADTVKRFFAFEQLGDWTRSGVGAASDASSYYTWCGSGGAPGDEGWKLSAGPIQQPGLGLSNTFLTTQGGVGGQSAGGNTFNNTGYSPINQSPGLQALVDWNAATSGAATGYVFSGPSSGFVGVPVTLAITPDASVTDTVTLSDGGAGGTFSPSATVTFTASSATQNPTYTPSATGTKTLTATSTAGGAVSGSPISLSVAAISYTLSGASSGFDGVPITLTVTPSGIATDTITLSDSSGGGSFSPSATLTFSASSSPQSPTYTPGSTGTKSVTATSTAGGTVTGSPLSITVAARGYTVTGASIGFIANAIAYTVTPSGTTTDTMTFSDASGGGAFSPTSLSWSGTSNAQVVHYTPGTVGTKTLTFASGDGGTVFGSPLSLVVSRVGYTLSGPSSGSIGNAMTFTVTPAASVTDTITVAHSGSAGTLSTATLTFTASAAPQAFTFLPSAVGTATITATSSSGGTVTGSPLTATITIVTSSKARRWFLGMARMIAIAIVNPMAHETDPDAARPILTPVATASAFYTDPDAARVITS